LIPQKTMEVPEILHPVPEHVRSGTG